MRPSPGAHISGYEARRGAGGAKPAVSRDDQFRVTTENREPRYLLEYVLSYRVPGCIRAHSLTPDCCVLPVSHYLTVPGRRLVSLLLHNDS